VTKIDAFAHILPPAYADRLERITSGDSVSDRILGYRPWIREDPALIDLDARWRTIDPFGDYRQILTLAVPPLDELGERRTALELATEANDELAGLVGRYPDRFAGFVAALPMNDPHAAAAEFDRAMTQLGALGAQLHTNVGGAPLDEPRLFFGSDHVLFGTDMPLGGPNVVADTIADITSLGLPEADEAAIFAGNTRRLLGIGG
jgi:uncharacterized protein